MTRFATALLLGGTALLAGTGAAGAQTVWQGSTL